MSENTPLLRAASAAHRPRNFLVASIIIAGGCLLGLILLSHSGGHREQRKVPLEAHIMSKCPDAKDCLVDLIVPALSSVNHMVDFKLSYIGEPDEKEDYGVACKHGSLECLGNMFGLCAAEVYPNPRIYVGFVTCLTRNWDKIPEGSVVQNCALDHGVSMDDVNKCVRRDLGPDSEDLLKKSVMRSKDAKVTKSCTVRLNDQVRCVRDDGEWKECGDGSSVDALVQDIKNLHRTWNRRW